MLQEHERRAAETKGQEALDHAISAAELYMKAAGKAKTPEDRKRLRRKFADLIALGERLKTAARGSVAVVSRPSEPPVPPVPESSRALTTTEKTIILRASRLHGSVFLPWESAPSSESFAAAGSPAGAYMYVECAAPANVDAISSLIISVTPLPSRSLPSSRPSLPAGGVPQSLWQGRMQTKRESTRRSSWLPRQRWTLPRTWRLIAPW